MRRTSSLDAVVPVLRQLILAELLVREARPMYRVQLAKKLNVPPSSLQRPLLAMVRTGLLRSTKRGREVLYEVDPENPLVPELRGLLRKSHGLVEVVREAVRPFVDRIYAAFIYGSVASGSERPASDVDLIVIGDVSLAEIAPALHRAEQTLGRPLNAVLYTEQTLKEKIAARNHYLHSVLAKPKLFVVGTEHDLEEAARRRAGRSAPDKRGRAPGPSGRRRPQSSRRKG